MKSRTTLSSLKTFTVAGFALTVLVFGGIPVFAHETGSDVSRITPGAKREAAVTANMDRLKSRGDGEIDRRIAALKRQLALVNGMKRLTDSQKSSFTGGITSQVASLTALKAKIDADTDIAALRTDVQSIVASYRIFALYMPQVSIMAHADRILALIAEMKDVSGKLQSRIDEAKNSGHDVSSLTHLMTDRANKLADAATQATNALNAVLPLAPEGYPGNRPTLVSARGMLQIARQDLNAAQKDANSIRQQLKSWGIAKITPTPKSE